MFRRMFSNINKRINSGNSRSILAKKHIIYSFIIKSISILIGLAYVPLLIDYLDAERYGIWLTLSSIISWFSFFNLGLGNGLRNNFTIAVADNNHELACKYVSTTYAILTVIFSIIILLFWIVNPFLDWAAILNTTIVDEKELSTIALLVFTFFCLRFIFDIVAVVLSADQRPALANAFGPIGNIFILAFIYFLIYIKAKSSLLILGALLSITPVLVLMIATLILFNGRYKKYKPSFKNIDFRYNKTLLNLGLKFFILQIASLVFFSSSNIIITQYLNPGEVTVYNIAYKYFSLPLMAMSIVIMPIWSAVTDAFHKKDYEWLKRTLNKLNKLSILFSIGILILLLLSSYAFHFWIGDRVEIPLKLSITMSLYFIIKMLVTPYSSYINGMGTLTLSIIILVVEIFMFIPISIYFTKLYGVIGPVIAMSLTSILSLAISFIQVNKNLKKKAHGIWGK